MKRNFFEVVRQDNDGAILHTETDVIIWLSLPFTDDDYLFETTWTVWVKKRLQCAEEIFKIYNAFLYGREWFKVVICSKHFYVNYFLSKNKNTEWGDNNVKLIAAKISIIMSESDKDKRSPNSSWNI